MMKIDSLNDNNDQQEWDVFLSYSLEDDTTVKKIKEKLKEKDPELKIYFASDEIKKSYSYSTINDAASGDIKKSPEGIYQFLHHLNHSKIVVFCFNKRFTEFFHKEITTALENKDIKKINLSLPGTTIDKDEIKKKFPSSPDGVFLSKTFFIKMSNNSDVKELYNEIKDILYKSDKNECEGHQPEKKKIKYKKIFLIITILLIIILFIGIGYFIYEQYSTIQNKNWLLKNLQTKNHQLKNDKCLYEMEKNSRMFAYDAIKKLTTDKLDALKSAVSACEFEKPTYEAQDILLSLLVDRLAAPKSLNNQTEVKNNHTDAIISMATSNKNILATGSSDGTIKLWTITEKVQKIIQSIENKENEKLSEYSKLERNQPVSALAFNTLVDDEIFIGDISGRIRWFKNIFDDPKPVEIKTNVDHTSKDIFFLSVHPASGRLFTGSSNKIEIYDISIQKQYELIDVIPAKHYLQETTYKSIAIQYQSQMNQTDENMNILLITGISNGDVVQWKINDIKNKKNKKIGKHDGIQKILFIPNKNNAITVGFDRKVRRWTICKDFENSIQTQWITVDKDIFSLASVSRGKRLISGNGDHSISIWDADDLQQIYTYPIKQHSQYITALAASINSSYITGDYRGNLFFWETIPKAPINKNSTYFKTPICMAYHPNKPILAVGDENGKIKLINTKDDDLEKPKLKPIPLAENEFQSEITDMNFSLDGTKLIYCNDNNQIIIYDTHKEKSNIVLNFNNNITKIRHVTFLNDSNSFIYSNNERIEYFKSKKINDTLKFNHEAKILCMAFNPKKKWIATAGADCNLIIQPVEICPESKKIYEKKFDHDIHSVAFSKKGKYLACGDAVGQIHLIDLDTKKYHLLKRRHKLWINSIAFNPKQETILVTSSYDKTIIIWDINHDKIIGKPLNAHNKAIENIVFQPDGAILISCGRDHYINFWEMSLKAWISRGKNFIN